jgi:hypothetical protein
VLGTATAQPMRSAYGLAISPDGGSLYVAADEDHAILELSRDASGALTQLATPDDCVQETGGGDCGTDGTGLSGDPLGVAVSPQGDSMYVVTSGAPDSVVEFSRAQSTTTTGTFTWSGAGDDVHWSDGDNWQGGVAPTGTDLVLHFPSGIDESAMVDDLGSGVTIATLEFDGPASVSGNALSPTSIVAADSATVTIGDDLPLTADLIVHTGSDTAVELSGAISGAGGVTVTGSGVLTLDGSSANTNTGQDNAIDTATLQLGKTGGVRATTGEVATPNFTASTIRWLADNQINDTAGHLFVTSFGTADLNGHSDTIGRLEMADGTVETGAGTLTVAGQISNNNNAGTISGNLHLTSDAHVITDEAADNSLTIDATLTGSGSITSQDLGVLTLDDACQYTGPLTVTAGQVNAPNGYGGTVTQAGGTFTGGTCPSTPPPGGGGGGPSAPVNTAPPAISGTPRVGNTLTTDNGSWTGNPTSFTYQWQRCTSADATTCDDISDATSKAYPVVGADVGSWLRVIVVAHNDAGASGGGPSATEGPVDALADPTGLHLSSNTTHGGHLRAHVSWTGAPANADGVRVCLVAGRTPTSNSNCADPIDVAAPSTHTGPLPIVPGQDYAVTAFAFVAGTAPSYSTGVSTTSAGTQLTIAAPDRTTYGHRLHVGTTLTDADDGTALSGAQVALWARPTRAGAHWSQLRRATTSARGTARADVKPHHNTTYQWRYAGDATHHRLATVSSEQSVVVRQQVTVRLARHANEIFGAVHPATGGASVSVMRRTKHGWESTELTATVHRQVLPDGREAMGYVISLPADLRGHRIRVVTDATADNAAGRSRTIHV